jgi:hypothetical protein
MIRSLAAHFIDLEKISFTAFGSLHPSSSVPIHSTIPDSTQDPNINIGPFVRYFPASATPPYFSGPFATAKEMYLTYINHLLDQTIEGRRYAPAYEVDAYLILLEAKVLVEGCKELEEEQGWLKHGDDKGDHYMVDADGNITSVIDWEWSV